MVIFDFWKKVFIRQVEVRFIFIKNQMLKTLTLNGWWQKLAIDRLWVDKQKMANYITAEDTANKVSNSYGQLSSGICIATDPNNSDKVYIAERANAEPEDCVCLGVWWELRRPLTDVKALNELRIMWQSWDKVYVQAL